MAKIANEYFKVDPWKIIEEGYNPSFNRVSESVFSLGNEYTGVRGFFEEGISAPSLVGTYFNGIYEYAKDPVSMHYKGIIKRVHFMINSVNWLSTHLEIDGEVLDLAHVKLTNFRRELDFKTGELSRSFVWHLKSGKIIECQFHRLLSMESVHSTYQKITLKPLNFTDQVVLTVGLDFNIVHWGKFNFWTIVKHDLQKMAILGETKTKQWLCSSYTLHGEDIISREPIKVNKSIKERIVVNLKENKPSVIEKRVINFADKNQSRTKAEMWRETLLEQAQQVDYHTALEANRQFWSKTWNDIDIQIEGDPKNQQGIRFCLFQLVQTYHGEDESNNIGAKGLTGEAYSGHAFWDTETYCLPFYLFNNPDAAKNLLMFRYHTLNQARARAKEIDCQGACYPIATLNGYESCDLWQHASLQPQPSTAVAYAIWHYVKNTQDTQFLKDYGLEMLVEISRYVASRGDYNATRTRFGLYGVMGPDEFQMMVHHDTYTNYLAKRTIDYTLEALGDFLHQSPNEYQALCEKLALSNDELVSLKDKADKMYILYNSDSQLFEQHQGYFDLPHIDIHSIPVTDFPLYAHWSYDRIYRNDMIKQPAVLMMMFLYNQSFTPEQKLRNYEFYEPRCIHESSLSPSIHSILAAELNKVEEATKFFGFATRLDLDDYNRNASEGLHTTSIAAAWVTIVYGFGGMRSDGKLLKFAPVIPGMWKKYSFKVNYRGSNLKVVVEPHQVTFDVSPALNVPVQIYNQIV